MNESISRRDFVGMTAIAIIAGCGMMAYPDMAYAGSAYGSQVSLSAGGKTYYGKCMVAASTTATGYAITSASSVVANGWIGAYVCLADSNGRCRASKTAYSGSSTQYFNVQTSSVNAASGSSYHAYGTLYGWNGSGYSSKPIPQTPNASRAAAAFAVDSYPVNADGLTYGSILSAEYVGEEPDLVSAVSENGVEGFVRIDNLKDPIPRTPEEAVALYSEESSRTIPLVDLDGNQLDVIVLHYGGGTCEPLEVA